MQDIKKFEKRNMFVYGTLTCFTFMCLLIGINAFEAFNECGVISVREPVIQNRSVTFTFKPATSLGDDEIVWYKYASGSIKLSDGPANTITSNQTTHVMVITRATYNLEYYINRKTTVGKTKCSSMAIKLNLYVLSDCGLLYLRTEKVREGVDVELEYYPTLAVYNNYPDYYVIYWMSNTTATGRWEYMPTNTDTRYAIRPETNKQFVLTIKQFDISMNGEYKVQCKRSPAKYTLPVRVVAPIKPSSPQIAPVERIDNCERCIVGEAGTNTYIACRTTGGTIPVDIKIFVGNQHISGGCGIAKDGHYMCPLRLQLIYHGRSVRCEVMNEALTAPLEASAIIYIKIKPLVPNLPDIPIIKEGEPVQIACKSTGRPAPSIGFYFSKNNTILDSQASATYNNNTQEYTTVAVLSKLTRNFNQQTIKCCNTDLSECSLFERKITYKFPPTSIHIVPPVSPIRENKPAYVIKLSCNVIDANPGCKTTWKTRDVAVVETTKKLATISENAGTSSTSDLRLNVSKQDNGKIIDCIPECSEFQTSLIGSYTLHVPYMNAVSVNTLSKMIVEGNTVTINCTAESDPVSKMTIQKDNVTVESTPCGTYSACVSFTDITMASSGVYKCVAVNDIFGTSMENIKIKVTATIAGEADELSEKSSALVPVAVVLAIILVIAVIAVIVFIKRRPSQRTSSVKRRVQIELSNPQQDGDDIVNRANDPVYGNLDQPAPNVQEGDCSANSNDQACTYATVIPRAQRQSQEIIDQPSDKLPDTKENELVYAELDLEVRDTAQTGDHAIPQKEAETEYVSIDFNKKAEPDNTDEENIYANQ